MVQGVKLYTQEAGITKDVSQTQLEADTTRVELLITGDMEKISGARDERQHWRSLVAALCVIPHEED